MPFQYYKYDVMHSPYDIYMTCVSQYTNTPGLFYIDTQTNTRMRVQIADQQR